MEKTALQDLVQKMSSTNLNSRQRRTTYDDLPFDIRKKIRDLADDARRRNPIYLEDRLKITTYLDNLEDVAFREIQKEEIDKALDVVVNKYKLRAFDNDEEVRKDFRDNISRSMLHHFFSQGKKFRTLGLEETTRHIESVASKYTEEEVQQRFENAVGNLIEDYLTPGETRFFDNPHPNIE